MSRKFAIIFNEEKPMAVGLAGKVCNILSRAGAEALVCKTAGKLTADVRPTVLDSYEELASAGDFIISIGGDGTIIRAAKYAGQYAKPLLGINAGRLGFSAELDPNELDQITRLLDGNYKTDKRMLLNVAVEKDGETKNYLAVNDAVISRGNLSRMVDLSVDLDCETMVSYRADGVVVATPTGSTAYSLSAGGPVVDPLMRCFVLAPICPHSLYSRAVIFGENSVISICAKAGHNEESYLTIDGQKSIPLSEKDTVKVKKSDLELMMISLKNKNFFKQVYEKLGSRE